MKKILLVLLLPMSLLLSNQVYADCSGIKLVRHWTEGNGWLNTNTSVYARIKNTSSETKFVYVEVENTRRWATKGPFKVFANDIADFKVGHLTNFAGGVRIGYCE